MTLRLTPRFSKRFAKLDPPVQDRVESALASFIEDPTRKSLRRKKLKGHKDLWEISADMNYRVLLRREADASVWYVVDVGKHDLVTQHRRRRGYR